MPSPTAQRAGNASARNAWRFGLATQSQSEPAASLQDVNAAAQNPDVGLTLFRTMCAKKLQTLARTLRCGPTRLAKRAQHLTTATHSGLEAHLSCKTQKLPFSFVKKQISHLESLLQSAGNTALQKARPRWPSGGRLPYTACSNHLQGHRADESGNRRK